MEQSYNQEFNQEKISPADRIYARTPKYKTEAEIYVKNKFENQKWDEASDKELEKTNENLEIINLVNEYTNNMLSEFQMKEYNITQKNIHILKEKDYKKISKEETETDTEAYFSLKKQAILLQEEESNLQFAIILFHEMIHAKSFYSVILEQEDSYRLLSPAQTGIEIRGKDDIFSNLNEAIIESLTKKFFKEISKKPLFQEEIKKIDEVKKYWRDKNPYFSQDIFCIHRDENGNETPETFAYRKARKALNLLIDKTYIKNVNNFKNPEEVFDLFAKSIFTGDIVGEKSWGRLVDKTFGAGTLKKIAEKDSNLEELNNFIDNL